jgi:hypothetical protein
MPIPIIHANVVRVQYSDSFAELIPVNLGSGCLPVEERKEYILPLGCREKEIVDVADRRSRKPGAACVAYIRERHGAQISLFESPST